MSLEKDDSIKWVPIKELKPHYANSNKHPKEQIERLAKIIKYQGFRSPIQVSNFSGFIVVGHGRLEAAKQLGLTKVPVSYQDFDNVEQEIAHLNADNAVALWAQIDMTKVEQSIKDFDLDFDTDFLGFDGFERKEEKDKSSGLTEDDAVPETSDNELGVHLGDIYQLGDHRLMCGDATDETTVLKLLDGQTIDMVYTDPPYGISEKGDRTKRNGKDSLKKGVEYKSFVDDSVEYAVKAFNLAQETLKIKVQIWWGANYYAHSIPQSNNWLVWDKRVEDKQKNFNSDCELAWVENGKSSVRIFRHLWKGLIKGSEHGVARVHPTQKPIALAEWCFENYGEHKAVLDLFLGSGSTLIACEKTNRKCYGMELDPHYCSVIIKRWQEYTGKEAVKLNV